MGRSANSNRQHSTPGQEVTLARSLGLLDATMIGVGGMIGAGIFVLTGIAAGVAGPASILAFLVAASDAISGARPGARREILETYIKRLEDLERLCSAFPFRLGALVRLHRRVQPLCRRDGQLPARVPGALRGRFSGRG